MLQILVTCEKMHMVLVVVLDGYLSTSRIRTQPWPFRLGLDSDTCAEIISIWYCFSCGMRYYRHESPNPVRVAGFKNE